MKPERDIDKIIEQIRQLFPLVKIEQLKVSNPADDDGIWYFWLSENPSDDIQIENASISYGDCPFLIENNRNDERLFGNTIEEVIKIISEHLKTSITKKE